MTRLWFFKDTRSRLSFCQLSQARSPFRQCLNLGECHSPLRGVAVNGDLVDFWWGRSPFRQCLNLGECHSPLRGVVMNGDLVDFWLWAIVFSSMSEFGANGNSPSCRLLPPTEILMKKPGFLIPRDRPLI
ncbi:MAG: hypothetical protein ACM65L_21010 [Microcoleus sp.]